MKKQRYTLRLGVALCLVLGLLLVTFTANADPEVTVSIIAPAQVGAGTDFTAKVDISYVTNFDACDYEVVFPSSFLELTSVTDGQIDGTCIPIVSTHDEDGSVKVVENLPCRVSGSGYLAELHFKAKTAGAGDTATIDLQNGTLSDWLGQEIPTTWVSATVEIVSTNLVAGFWGDPTEAIKGSTVYTPTVAFTDTTTGGAGPLYPSYDWDFGDGEIDSGSNPTHPYAPSGTRTGQKYTVSLTVEDSLGVSDEEVKTDYITIYQMGDINEDLTVNSVDITEIELIVSGAHDRNWLTDDAKEDGSINALDITRTELLVATATD
ncbi:MAG: PKD domain-containing protein [Chloroflexota bacterium]|nr:PKD domain-containing protein [Chloroflexota bacterium]